MPVDVRLIGGPLLDAVYVRPGSQAYHRPGRRGFGDRNRWTACGMLWLDDLVVYREVEAIVAWRPCGRCWFRVWRLRAAAVAILRQETPT